MMNDEVLSGIKVLVALAHADGELHDDERVAIHNALDGAELPEGVTAESLLASAGAIDLDTELTKITSDESRKRTYDAASALVYVDGHFSDEERAMLGRIAGAFGIARDDSRAERFKRFTSAVPPAVLAKEVDPDKRAEIVQAEIATASEVSAVLASTELPIAAESCLFTNNVRLARNVGVAWGHDANEAFWRTFVSNVVGAASSWFAVTSLLKLVPGHGSAPAAYASTFALGKVVNAYFEAGESLDADALRDAHKKAKSDGRAAAKRAEDAVAARRERFVASKKALDASLASAKITETEYADQLVALS